MPVQQHNKFQSIVEQSVEFWRNFSKSWDDVSHHVLSNSVDGAEFLLKQEQSRYLIGESLKYYGVELHQDPKAGWVWKESKELIPHEHWIVEIRKTLWMTINTGLAFALWVKDSVVTEPGEDPYRASVQAFINVIKTLPLRLVLIYESGLPEDVRTSALASLTGFIATMVSIEGEPGTRLKQAISSSGGEGSDYAKLLELLPGAVISALGERNTEEPLLSAINEIRTTAAGIVELDLKAERFHGPKNKDGSRIGFTSIDRVDMDSDGDPVETISPDSILADFSPKNPNDTVENFIFREEARQVIEEARKHLSPRSLEVLEFKLQHPDFKGIEVARELGMADGTYYTHWHEIKSAFKNAKQRLENDLGQ